MDHSGSRIADRDSLLSVRMFLQHIGISRNLRKQLTAFDLEPSRIVSRRKANPDVLDVDVPTADPSDWARFRKILGTGDAGRHFLERVADPSVIQIPGLADVSTVLRRFGLKDREWKLMVLRHANDQKLRFDDIAVELGNVTRARAQQMHAHNLLKIGRHVDDLFRVLLDIEWRTAEYLSDDVRISTVSGFADELGEILESIGYCVPDQMTSRRLVAVVRALVSDYSEETDRKALSSLGS